MAMNALCKTLAPAVLVWAMAAPPSAAQPGDLDVPYVPTPENVVDAMLRLAKVGPQDLVYDLGSGDGRIVITAAERYGAQGVGIDIDPARIAEARENADAAGVESQVRFVQGDLFEADIKPATVVTLYLLGSVNEEIRPRLLNQLRPGTRIVSHAFDMGPWKPDATATVDGADVFLWIVPAQAAGQWIATIEQPAGAEEFSMALEQQFQDVAGMVVLGGIHTVVEGAEVQGRQLTLNLDDGNGATRRLTGRIDGDRIEGWVFAGNDTNALGRWSATRVGDFDTGQLRTGTH
ncbi:MAG: class I SAM-dependent methyltransferase [Gammaproteobacteria bacterium]|nr:class I SAM-dependent methyltransferase [Gammaproteobacteria bacterium]